MRYAITKVFWLIPLLLSPAPSESAPQVTIPAGTEISVRLAQALDTSRDGPGTQFLAHLASDIKRDGRVIIPRGVPFRGHLVESASSGRLRGRAILSLRLDSFVMDGKTYAISSSTARRVSKDHKARNLALIGGGTAVGAAIGAIAAGGAGALIGAGAGAAAGTGGAALTGKRNIRLAPETYVRFILRRPLQVHR